jgi:hypothetical protein
MFAGLYSATEVAELEGQLSWLHIVELLGIKDERQRQKFQRECVAKQWSSGELKREIRARVGRQRRWGQGGRPSHRPRNLPEALADLDRLLSGVVRWYGGLETARASELAERSARRRSRKVTFDVSQFPQRLREEIEDTIRRVEQLRHQVQGALNVQIGESEAAVPRRPK